jgi:hypothetical protein
MLLRRMADFQPELVAAAHEELGASPAQSMAAHNRWQSLLHSRTAPRGTRLYQAVLGPPDGERVVELGDVAAVEWTWRLPVLWPDLRWQVITAGDAALGGTLVRASESVVPPLSKPEGLAPWSCVVGDVVVRQPDARHIDPETFSWWAMRLPSGHELWFVYGLLQEVRAPGAEPAARVRPPSRPR